MNESCYILRLQYFMGICMYIWCVCLQCSIFYSLCNNNIIHKLLRINAVCSMFSQYRHNYFFLIYSDWFIFSSMIFKNVIFCCNGLFQSYICKHLLYFFLFIWGFPNLREDKQWVLLMTMFLMSDKFSSTKGHSSFQLRSWLDPYTLQAGLCHGNDTANVIN